MKEKYFDMAERISVLSDYPRVHIGAVIVRGGEVLSFGVNRKKTHPLQKKYNHYRGYQSTDTVHAEMNAIINAKCDLKGATIYVFRKNPAGKLLMCKPCPACISAMKDCGIKDVYYTTQNGYCYQKIERGT